MHYCFISFSSHLLEAAPVLRHNRVSVFQQSQPLPGIWPGYCSNGAAHFVTAPTDSSLSSLELVVQSNMLYTKSMPIIATFFKTLLFRFQFSVTCWRLPEQPCVHLWHLQSENFHPTYTHLMPKASWSVTVYNTLGHKCTEHSALIYQTSKDCSLNPAGAIHFSRCTCLCLNPTARICVAELLWAEVLEPQQYQDVFSRIFTQLDASLPVKHPPRVHLPNIKITYGFLLLV